MKKLQLSGLLPATVTPFAADLSIDTESLHCHLDETASIRGVTALVVNGHLGEVLTLSTEERAAVVRAAVEVRRPGQLIVAGIEARLPSHAVREAASAAQAGADALLVLPPFDVRPYRKLNAHAPSVTSYFRLLDKEVGQPMIIFQYPDHSGAAYSLEVLQCLAEIPSVVGIKDASGHVTRYAALWDALHDSVSVLAACDSPPLLGMLLHGAHGSLIGISVISPGHWVSVVEAAAGGRAEEARQIYNRVCLPLMDAVFDNQSGYSPISEAGTTKEALVQLGQIPSSRVRPPAVNVDESRRSRIEAALHAAGLL